MTKLSSVDPVSSQLSPGLYLIATPIGNLGDMTIRGIETLQKVDVIYCEDTRKSLPLLKHYNIEKPLRSYHDHNAAETRPFILEEIKQGKSIALISDAGTPLISDPGFKLVREVKGKGFYVTTIPGPSAVIAALTLSTLPTDQFFFGGFFPDKKEKQKNLLDVLKNFKATLIFFEAPHRIAETCKVIAQHLGNRKAILARELTKKFEETVVGTLLDLSKNYKETPPLGECVLLIEGQTLQQKSIESYDVEILKLLESHRVKEVAEMISKLYDFPKKEVYARALLLAQKVQKPEKN